MEKNWLDLMNLSRKILISTAIVYHLMKKNLIEEEKSYEFQNLKEKINPNNLIYKYKTVGRSPKDLSDFIDLCFYNFIFYLYLYIKIRRPNFF